MLNAILVEQSDFEALQARVAALEVTSLALAAELLGTRIVVLGAYAVPLNVAPEHEENFVQAGATEELRLLAILVESDGSTFDPIEVQFDVVGPNDVQDAAFVLALPNVTAGAPYVAERLHDRIDLGEGVESGLTSAVRVRPGHSVRARVTNGSAQQATLRCRLIALRGPA